MSLLYFYWRDVNNGGSCRNLCDVILAFVHKQMVTSYYSVNSSPFPPNCGKAHPRWAMPWSAPETFLSTMIWGSLFRISGWSASSSLYFTWYLLNAESIYGHFPNDVPSSLPENRAAPFFLLHVQRGQVIVPGSPPYMVRGKWIQARAHINV